MVSFTNHIYLGTYEESKNAFELQNKIISHNKIINIAYLAENIFSLIDYSNNLFVLNIKDLQVCINKEIFLERTNFLHNKID